MTLPHHVRNDLNNDGRSDIFWRDDNGVITDWLGTDNGGFVPNWDSFNHNLDPSWIVSGLGDFNGDNREDILYRSTSGIVISSLETASAGFQSDWENAAVVPTDWHITGTLDVNGDGRTDILWRNNSGQITDWLGSSDTTTIVDVPAANFVRNWSNAHFDVPTGWNVVGLGDFDGDGHDDILWRDNSGDLTDWLGQANGGFSDNSANAFIAVPLAWTVAGTGDFNGDHITDVLWRNADGTLVDWLGQNNGGFAANWNNSVAAVPTNWQVAATGDYDGDGRDDILWRSDTGMLTDWLGTNNGGFINNWANAHAFVPPNWHVQPDTSGAGLWDY